MKYSFVATGDKKIATSTILPDYSSYRYFDIFINNPVLPLGKSKNIHPLIQKRVSGKMCSLF